MKLIAELDQHKLGWTSDADMPIDFHRRAARAVLRDETGRIAVMYFSTTGSSKLPGGGIDEGENIETALRREVREETGYEIGEIKELGIIEEYRYTVGMHQTSYCYLANSADFIGSDLTDTEKERGMELRWYDSLGGAIEAISNSHIPDEGTSEIMLEMMKLREITILRAAQLLP